MCLLGPRARGGAVFGPLCYSGLPRDGAAAQGRRWRNAAGAMDLSLPQRTTRSVGAGEGGLLAQLHAWIASVLPPLANARGCGSRRWRTGDAVAATRRYLKTTYLCSKEPMLARLGRFRCGAII